LINQAKIQEWIRQIEDYPLIAPFIIRRIADRLIELDTENEELREENYSLREGQKVNEYEQKISDLEYQIELLKRQLKISGSRIESEFRVLAYQPDGKVFSFRWEPCEGQLLAGMPFEREVHFLWVQETDELLFLLDSGRIDVRPVGDIPITLGTTGETAKVEPYQIELRGREELSSVMSITLAPTLQMVVQISRRGYVRSISMDYFQMFLSSRNVGSGVKTKSDQVLCLVLCNPEDVLVLISRSGYWFALPVQSLSAAVLEAVKLSLDDHLVGVVRVTSADKEKEIRVVSTTGQIAGISADQVTLLRNTAKRGKPIFANATEKVCDAGLVGKDDRVFLIDEKGSFMDASIRDGMHGDRTQTASSALSFTAMVVLPGERREK